MKKDVYTCDICGLVNSDSDNFVGIVATNGDPFLNVAKKFKTDWAYSTDSVHFCLDCNTKLSKMYRRKSEIAKLPIK